GIEDACQAHGAEYKGRRVGAIGHMGAFSFQVSKNIAAGEGGAVTTNIREYAERAWSIHNVGRVPDGAWYEHRIMGWNLRMTQFQGAILLCQMERVAEQMARRERNAEHLRKRLEDVPGLEMTAITPGGRSAYHLIMLKYDASEFDGLPRQGFIRAMGAEGIPVSSGYVPLYRSDVFLKGIAPEKCPMACRFYGKAVDYRQTECPVCEQVSDETGVWLAQNVLLADEEALDDIVEAAVKVRENVGELVEASESERRRESGVLFGDTAE
ncbi:MAG: DegT/DnrJ/EryC1/StrS family aminotransferase, partial [Armatimonadota bacterium]